MAYALPEASEQPCVLGRLLIREVAEESVGECCGDGFVDLKPLFNDSSRPHNRLIESADAITEANRLLLAFVEE